MRIKKVLTLLTAIFIGSMGVFVYSEQSMSAISARKFGPLAIGGDMISGYGDWTFAPHKTIPASSFYVAIVQDDYWCSLEDCDLIGALIQTMGGWLEMTNEDVFPDIKEIVGFDSEENENIKSIVIIGDSTSKIAGIYPNKGIKELESILRLHPELVHFDLLKGVHEFGSLRVGEQAPLQPGDPTGFQEGELSTFPYTRIPSGKKFYVFSIQKKLLGKGYCAFFECEPPNDYPHGSYIEELGGWFSSDGSAETARAFGLDPDHVAKGEKSLVVVTDSAGTIRAIHPGRTFADILGILSQHKDLVDVKEWYYGRYPS